MKNGKLKDKNPIFFELNDRHASKDKILLKKKSDPQRSWLMKLNQKFRSMTRLKTEKAKGWNFILPRMKKIKE